MSFDITASGYEPKSAARLVQYNDNANATGADLSSFWEIQGFTLQPTAAEPGTDCVHQRPRRQQRDLL